MPSINQKTYSHKPFTITKRVERIIHKSMHHDQGPSHTYMPKYQHIKLRILDHYRTPKNASVPPPGRQEKRKRKLDENIIGP